jgi:hypothetical protein
MDGENYNIGFVDVTDRPYTELIEAARTSHKRLLAVHSSDLSPFAQYPLASGCRRAILTMAVGMNY